MLLSAGVLLGGTPASAHHAPGPCDFHRLEGESIQHFSKRLIICAVTKLGPVPGGATRAICIAKRESGLDPSAMSKTGMYRGLYQHAWEFWAWRYETFTLPKWDLSPRALNPRTNAIVAIRMVRHYGTWNTAGWPRKEC
jgi:hypothetical protein